MRARLARWPRPMRSNAIGGAARHDVERAHPEQIEYHAPVYYPNCGAARAGGAAPIRRGERGLIAPLDRDDEGVACEAYRWVGASPVRDRQ